MTVSGVLPLALLLAYGVAFASASLGASLIAFDDHPGQLYRVWHVVRQGPAPWAWNAGWWTGYPELQFYPPAFAYAAALVHGVSLGTVSVTASYQALVWLACLAPGPTVWLLLRRATGDGWLALPGAFVAQTLSAGLSSGVEGGVHIGMIAARLGWAVLPLFPLALDGWMRGEREFPWTVAPLAALVALTHPAHLPAAVVLVGLAAALAKRPRVAAMAGAAWALALAAGLTAFWSLPLVARAEHTRALAWGTLSLSAIAGDPLLVVLLVLAVVPAVALVRRGSSPLVALLTLFPWVTTAVVLATALVLEPLGLRWLPADRVADSAWLGIVLAAALGMSRLLARAPRVRVPLSIAAVLTLALIALPAQTLTLWPRVAEWPRFGALERGLRLDALWSTLRAAPAGRVLFVRSGVPLAYRVEHWRLHSHVTAMTPLAAGRDIVNGTFTHPSPVAALLYRGDAGPAPIRELVERLDGRRLFGRPLEALDGATLDRYAERLGISVVVALDEDLPRLGALSDNPRFVRVRSSPPFVVYVARLAAPPPTVVAPGRLRLPVTGSQDGWLPALIAYYPLWRATAAGREIPTRRGEMGDLEVQVPPSTRAIELAYGPGAPEVAGVLVSAGSLVLLGLGRVRARLWRAPAQTSGS